MNRVPTWIPIVLALFIILILALATLIPSTGAAEELEEVEYYGVLQDDSDAYNLDFDPELVKQIQRALNKFLRKRGANTLSVDGVFGPATGQAVKLYQLKNKLTVDGICGPQTLKSLGIDPTSITSYPRWIPNLKVEFAKSTNGFAVHLNLGSHRLEAYRLVDGEWLLERCYLVATGNYKSGYFTDLTCLVYKGKSRDYICGTSTNGTWRGYDAIPIQRGDYFHSVLAHRRNGKWVFDDNSALGKDVSHGCVRQSRENAKWLRENLTRGTVIVIDDRAWELELTH
jgi:hypothetical protein